MRVAGRMELCTANAIGFVSPSGKRCWLPWSQITAEGEELLDGKPSWVEIPVWLARNCGLTADVVPR